MNQTFSRALEESDWERFLKYSGFVQEVCLFRETIAPETFSVMDATRSSEDIFPALKKFTCNMTLGSSNHICNLFFRKGLEELSLKTWEPPLRLLQNICMVASSLKILHLDNPMMISDSLTNSELSVLLRQLTSIVDLQLPFLFLTSNVFEMLSRKEHLQKLRLACGDNFAVRSPNPLLIYDYCFLEDGFPVLRELTLVDSSSEPHKHLSIIPAKPDLREFYFQLSGEPHHISIREYLLKVSCGFAGLVRLHITASVRDDNGALSDPTVVFSMLQPMLSLEHIRDFTFDHPTVMSLADEHITRIARAWPMLETFSFCNRAYYGTGQTHLTLSCLITFAECCPHLGFLSLAIDTVIKPPCQPTDSTVFTDKFYMLSIAESPLGDPTAVAFFIADLLPSGAEIRYELDDIDDAEGAQEWADVVTLVESILRARSRGVRRALGNHATASEGRI